VTNLVPNALLVLLHTIQEFPFDVEPVSSYPQADVGAIAGRVGTEDIQHERDFEVEVPRGG